MEKDIEQNPNQEVSTEAVEKNFSLLASAQSGRLLTVRDDLYEYSWSLQAVKLCRGAKDVLARSR